MRDGTRDTTNRVQPPFAALMITAMAAWGCGGGGEPRADDPPVAATGAGGGGTAGGPGGHGGDEGPGPATGTGGSSSSAGAGGAAPYLDLSLPEPSTSPVDTGSADVEFYADVPYDWHAETRLDIFVQKGSSAAPLVIHIHGGGFVQGSKSSAYAPQAAALQTALEAGFSFASLDYRLLAEVDADGVLKPLNDCKRALQFLRHHAAALHIDPARVALMGGSAGAGTSLWIALNDDMADGQAANDPVAQQSTRVSGAVANSTQSTYDVLRWGEVFAEYGIDVLEAVAAFEMEQRLMSFYGIDSLSELEQPATVEYRHAVDMLALMSPDDPPLYVKTLGAATEPKTEGQFLHHPLHAQALVDRANETGVPMVASIPALGVSPAPAQTDWEFVMSVLE